MNKKERFRVFFLLQTASADLSEDSYQFLDSICSLMSKTTVDSNLVEGHTDSGTILIIKGSAGTQWG